MRVCVSRVSLTVGVVAAVGIFADVAHRVLVDLAPRCSLAQALLLITSVSLWQERVTLWLDVLGNTAHHGRTQFGMLSALSS